jgi:phage portal protein BeeE
VLLTPDGRDLFYKINLPGFDDTPIPAEGILHLRGPSLDGIIGLSPIAYHRETIGLGIAAEKYGAAFFGNSAQPRGAVKLPGVAWTRYRQAAPRDLGAEIPRRPERAPHRHPRWRHGMGADRDVK